MFLVSPCLASSNSGVSRDSHRFQDQQPVFPLLFLNFHARQDSCLSFARGSNLAIHFHLPGTLSFQFL
jgi:hypothetical protein